jgi:hypothetical protein
VGRRPLVLLLTTLALMLGGSAAAEGNAERNDALAGYSVTCSASLAGAGCWIERPVWVLGSFEVAVGFDARAAWGAWERSYASPYAIVGWYAPSWAAWVEFAIPESGMFSFGKPDPFRAGFTFRF